MFLLFVLALGPANGVKGLGYQLPHWRGPIVKQIIRGEKETKVERVNLEQEMKQHVKLH